MTLGPTSEPKLSAAQINATGYKVDSASHHYGYLVGKPVDLARLVDEDTRMVLVFDGINELSARDWHWFMTAWGIVEGRRRGGAWIMLHPRNVAADSQIGESS
jgi:hypothetical protein